MMGLNLFKTSWPACGELDIMESVMCPDYPPACADVKPPTVFGTSHDTMSGDTGIGYTYAIPNGGNLSDAFHVYAIEWTTKSITWYLDDVAYGTENAPASPTTATWPFNDPANPFFIILNLAIGSGDNNSWGAPPNAMTADPAQMLVDYVRVYVKPGAGM